jgi:3-carboxy-cis,cis-muconate cycloisomerase
MRQVWSDENRTAKYVQIERALAIVQGRLGMIPQEAADEIVSHCHVDRIDMARCASRPSASAIRSWAW